MHTDLKLALNDVCNGMKEFPYCKRDHPSQVAEIPVKGRAIMTNASRSADERSALQQRRHATMGRTID